MQLCRGTTPVQSSYSIISSKQIPDEPQLGYFSSVFPHFMGFCLEEQGISAKRNCRFKILDFQL
jgi:hypothetical protein